VSPAGLLEQALAVAFADFDDNRHRDCEWGRVFWVSRDGLTLEPGELRMGTRGEVDLFTHSVRRRFAAGIARGRQNLVGTYHAHPSTLSLPQQFPSKCDLKEVSSLVDLWNTASGSGVAPQPLRVEFDLIQSGAYGDVFVVSARPDRSRFGSFSDQSRDLDFCLKAYEAEVCGAAFWVEPDTHAEYVNAARQILGLAARHLADRVTMVLRPYPRSPAA
jgi:hypothetical protein